MTNEENVLTYEGFLYKLEGNQIKITGYIGSDKAVNIPSKIKSKTVSIIGDYAFFPKELNKIGQSSVILEKVTLPDSIKHIGKHAFAKNKLKIFNFPKKLKLIDDYAFYGNLLKELTIPNSVTFIGKQSFRNNQLNNLKLSENIEVISDYSFAENFLKEVEIPKSVKTIGDYAFKVNEMKILLIPKTVETIGLNPFVYNELNKVINYCKKDVSFTFGKKPKIFNKF